MIEDNERYDRQISFFGAAGQDRIRKTAVGIVGLGGLGSHLAQQLAYLGITTFVLVDADPTSPHSLNRQITAYPDDVGTLKVGLAERMIRAIAPSASVNAVPQLLPHPDALTALSAVDLLLGGLDHDLPRLQLTDLASENKIAYIDAATDIHGSGDNLIYGGRVVTAGVSPGCLYCLGQLDADAIRHATQTPEQRATEADIYGVPVEELQAATGPSVVTINGLVASLAATEAMVHITGLRPARNHLVYRGDQGMVRINTDAPNGNDCAYCFRWLDRPIG
ncbi:ThiF family adenylyltransferase [Catellatospora bangladeshensis]|uniref:THIF-type NAD/FAD binding fold domain-containing protein n=1 Tax=Catellatospora bangladeshensis TaxID=310355 RepID=A0A8J3JM40_9ACTN|nr:ThiF family adenylyltransferase [Catellatospora bangladeshensis]GIF83146.1 hypothetical protein Cba03nite_44950 [Catellatospora bangladeshensis]